MIAAKLAWLAVLALYASVLPGIALANPVIRFIIPRIGNGYIRRHVMDAPFAIMFLALILHISVAILLASSISLNAAITALSLIGFSWSCISHFPERFANASERIPITSNSPHIFPILCFAGFTSSVLALLFFSSCYWAALPVLIWFFLGFIFLEIAIRRRQIRLKKMGSAGRKLAIYVINSNQGREGRRRDEYPFP